MMRMFVGVKARERPALLAALSRLGEMGKAVRAIGPDQMHVTLKFLGDIDGQVALVIADEIEQWVKRMEAFEWDARGTGAFPSAARPSVVWAGTAERERFAALAESVEEACARHGFSREARPFRPHVTLARIKFRPPPALAEWLKQNAETEFGPQRAEEVVLFRSELAAGGSVYTPVRVVRLANA